MINKKTKKNLFTLVCVVIGALIMAINIKTFVRAGNLFPGGFTGLTVMIQRISEKYFDVTISYSLVNILLNAVPAVIGYKTIGKRFTIYSCLMIFLTGIFVDFLPSRPVTNDLLLIAVFGGIFNGVGISFALKGKASSGGTDFIAVYLSDKLHAPAWNYVLGLNAVMLVVAGLLFDWNQALYSIIFQFVSTQVVSALHVRYKKVTVHIITSKPDDLSEKLMIYTHHGITRFEGHGCYSNQPRTLLYTVISTEELKEVIRFVHLVDDKAFINVMKTNSLEGRFYQEPIN